MMRRMLLGGVFAVTVCGAATAKPPLGPLSEGRELDPVVREFYQGEAPIPPAENGGPSRVGATRSDFGAWPLLTTFSVLDAILSGVVLPLGPCMTEM
jgi:hypothetical protein